MCGLHGLSLEKVEVLSSVVNNDLQKSNHATKIIAGLLAYLFKRGNFCTCLSSVYLCSVNLQGLPGPLGPPGPAGPTGEKVSRKMLLCTPK